MTNEQLKQLQIGDSVTNSAGDRLIIQHFGKFDNNKWHRSSRKNANGAWVWNKTCACDGFIHQSSIIEQIRPELFKVGK